MKSGFIPAGSSIKEQLKVCHRFAKMPAQRVGGTTGGWGGGVVNKINYAKFPGAHQSRGNNARVRVRAHGLHAFLWLTDNEQQLIVIPSIAPFFYLFFSFHSDVIRSPSDRRGCCGTSDGSSRTFRAEEGKKGKEQLRVQRLCEKARRAVNKSSNFH